jgi:hypothetical protein
MRPRRGPKYFPESGNSYKLALCGQERKPVNHAGAQVIRARSRRRPLP